MKAVFKINFNHFSVVRNLYIYTFMNLSMFTKKGEATLTVLIIGVLAVSLISAFSNSYTGNVVDSSEFTCSDTDGNDQFTRGNVIGQNETGSYNLTDICCSELSNFCSANYVNERACLSNQPFTRGVICPIGCSNGACSNRSCTDTDGDDPYTLGRIFGVGLDYNNNPYNYSYSYTDTCFSATRLFEQICVNNSLDPSFYNLACPNGCSNGACINPDPRICTDTDGDDPYTLGRIFGVGLDYNNNPYNYSYNDNCYSATRLSETICVNNSLDPYSYGYTCSNGCSNGACISAPAPTCIDTDGNNLFTLGNVSGQNDTGSYTLADYCSGPSNSYINERTCLANNQPFTNNLFCDNGCSNGICISTPAPTCIDTDPENDVYVKGRIYNQGGSHAFNLTDICSGSKKVKERICKPDGNPSYLIKTCPNNKKCIQAKGICQK